MSPTQKALQANPNSMTAEILATVAPYEGIISSITAVIGLFLAGYAIWFTHRSLAMQRQHNTLSVKPIINSTYSADEKNAKIVLQNCGLGPAIITHMWILIDEKPEGYDEILDIHGFLFDYETMYVRFHRTHGGITIKEGEEVNWFYCEKLDGSFSDKEYRNLRDWLESVGLCVKYEDIYGNKFEHNIQCSKIVP